MLTLDNQTHCGCGFQVPAAEAVAHHPRQASRRDGIKQTTLVEHLALPQNGRGPPSQLHGRATPLAATAVHRTTLHVVIVRRVTTDRVRRRRGSLNVRAELDRKRAVIQTTAIMGKQQTVARRPHFPRWPSQQRQPLMWKDIHVHQTTLLH